ncbi:MAG TPA: ATP-binding protein [Terriglobales bacterium]
MARQLPAPPRATTVLVVETEETQRQSVCRILREAGYQVLEAADSDHARRKISRSDTVIVGASVPDNESKILCQEIKSRQETASVPVVVLTRLEQTQDKQPDSRNGSCDAHLRTPLRRSELLNTIDAMMQVRWADLRARILDEEVEHRSAELCLLRDKMAEGLVELNEKGEIISLNASAERLLEMEIRSAVGKHFHSFVHADGKLCPRNCRLAELRSPTVNVENVFHRQNGSQLVAEFTLVSAAEFGLGQGTLVFFRDVTDRKQAEEMLCSLETLASRGRIAAVMAHEINNPLESVINLVYLIGQQPELSPATRQFVSMAERELARVGQITRQTLGFYRATDRPASVDLVELTESALAIYERHFSPEFIQVHREYGKDCEVQGFAGELRQVLVNLVSNAIDAIGRKGKLCVRVRRGRSWKSPDNEGVRITVTDTGPGMPRERRLQLFQPFFTTKGARGTGLGLWVSRGIVHKHGGELRVRSSTRPDRHGTSFSLFVPFGDGIQQSQDKLSAPHKAA